jgi:hypothetical protein
MKVLVGPPEENVRMSGTQHYLDHVSDVFMMTRLPVWRQHLPVVTERKYSTYELLLSADVNC